MRYRASWRYMSGWGVLIIIFGVCFVLAGVLLRETLLMVMGLGAFLYLWMISQRLSVELFSDPLIYHGWFKKPEVKFDKILSVKRTLNFNWPRNRLYGPLTYEIRTSGTCLLVNLLYFGPEFSRKFQERFHGELE